MSFDWLFVGFFSAIGALVLASLCGCASIPSGDQMAPLRLVPDIDCSGKASISVTGQASAQSAIGAGGAASGTMQIDCGDGFHLLHNKYGEPE